MKKALLLILVIFAGYKFYHNGFHLLTPASAVGKDGKPVVLLFTGPGCEEHCESIRGLLKQRGFDFDEIAVAGSDGAPVSNKYGVSSYPTTLIGRQQIVGDDLPGIASALMNAFGENAMTGAERRAMATHHDSQGRARVVMYGTDWCPYCKQQREFFRAHNIEFDDVDVEKSSAGGEAYRTLKGNGYPLTYVGYQRFSGLNESEILQAVEDAAKARTGS